MKKYKSLVLTVIGLLCSVSVSAHDFEVNGIYYNITSSTDMTVGVTFCGTHPDSYSNEYSGAVNIPESVIYNESIYSVTSIGESAFGVCSSLTSVEIPNSVTSIGGGAFQSCSSLTSVEIPNSVTSIESYAFCFCTRLTSVMIPNSVTSIGTLAFYYCSSLTSVVIPNSVTSIGESAFSVCSGLTSVVIPNSVTSIGVGAFSGCSGLTSVVIPNSVTSIGSGAFHGCSGLTSVEIGNSVTNIGMYAFANCDKMTRLSCCAGVPPTCGSGVFNGINKEDCVLQVPQSCLAAYQQADQWKDFLYIEDVLTAIGGVTVDGAVSATADVYSTNGMLIKRNAELKNLKHELPAGIYIIGGKKVWVK